MTIDERIEAIAINLDMLTRIHLDNDREFRERFQRAEERLQQNEQRLQQNEERYQRRFEENEVRLAQLMDSMNRLVRIVEAHEERLDDLEGSK